MESLKGKRLLILGGSLWKEAIRDFADKEQIRLISTGNDRSAGIFEIADECYDVNSIDSEAMKKLIIDKKIDGVYMGGSETVISNACVYINELGLPCYCTKEQWEFLQNKKKFKNLCIEFGLPVVPRYEVELESIIRDCHNVEFPVITKPADGCGSNGFSVCKNQMELISGYKFASENSASGSVVVEKFVENKGVVVFYTFSNGRMYFAGLEDKYPIQYVPNGGYVGGLFVFESRFTEEFRRLFEFKLERMFSSIGIKEGSVWIEVFHNGHEYYFNEVGYRYGGSVSVYPIDYIMNINQVAADMYYALTGKSELFGFETMISKNIAKGKHYCVYPIYASAGLITAVEGVEYVKSMNNVVYVTLTKGANDVIPETGSFSQIFALVHFVFEDLNELHSTISKIHETLKALDFNGNNKIYHILPKNITI